MKSIYSQVTLKISRTTMPKIITKQMNVSVSPVILWFADDGFDLYKQTAIIVLQFPFYN